MSKDSIIAKFTDKQESYANICLGTTIGHYAIDFDLGGVFGWNMALYKTPIEVYIMLLQKYSSWINDGATVFIALVYPIFVLGNIRRFMEENEYQYANVLFGKNKYSNIIRQIILKIMPAPHNEQYHVLRIMEELEGKSRYKNHLRPWEIRKMSEILIDEGWNREIGIPEFVQKGHLEKNKKVDEVMEYHRNKLRELILFCQHKGYRPILVGIPYSRGVNEYVPDTFKEICFYENVHIICKETGCSFFDYSADERIWDKDNYLEVQYLNRRGRRKFTNILLTETGIIHEDMK